MFGSVSTTPSYYNLLNPSSKSNSSSGSSVLDAISSAIDAASIADHAVSDLSDSVTLSPAVQSLLDGLSSGGTGIVGAWVGGTSSSGNLILSAAAKAAMKQAYATISAAAYNAASTRASANAIAANPMDKVINAYHSALNGDPVTTTTTEA
ncbi:MAG: hypothetical protein U1E36_03735 [Rickettsiales bacterium]